MAGMKIPAISFRWQALHILCHRCSNAIIRGRWEATGIDPAVSRIRTVETIDGVEITIPIKVSVFIALALTTWLFVWVVGIVGIIGHLLSSHSGMASTLLRVGGLAAWIVGGAAAMAWLTWTLIGREVVFADIVKLKHVRTLGPFSTSRAYRMAEIKRLRVAPTGFPDIYGGRQWWPTGPFEGPMIAFDYGESTACFGTGLDEAEAKMIVQLLTKRFRNLAA